MLYASLHVALPTEVFFVQGYSQRQPKLGSAFATLGKGICAIDSLLIFAFYSCHCTRYPFISYRRQKLCSIDGLINMIIFKSQFLLLDVASCKAIYNLGRCHLEGNLNVLRVCSFDGSSLRILASKTN